MRSSLKKKKKKWVLIENKNCKGIRTLVIILTRTRMRRDSNWRTRLKRSLKSKNQVTKENILCMVIKFEIILNKIDQSFAPKNISWSSLTGRNKIRKDWLDLHIPYNNFESKTYLKAPSRDSKSHLVPKCTNRSNKKWNFSNLKNSRGSISTRSKPKNLKSMVSIHNSSEMNEKAKLERTISMPIFYSNQRQESRSPERTPRGQIESSEAKNGHLKSESLVTNKVPEKMNYQVDKKMLLNRNGKYCIWRLLDYAKEKNNRHSVRESQSEALMQSGSDSMFTEVNNIDENENNKGILCGLYCQYTSSEVQWNIIKNILKTENIDYRNAILSSTGKWGDQKALINVKWWRDWWDYVNFETQFSWSGDLTSTELSSRGQRSHSHYSCSNKQNIIINKNFKRSESNLKDSAFYK